MLELGVFILTLLLDSRLLISAETVITCDGFVQRLTCESGVIHVQSATCGRTSYQTCSTGRPQNEISNLQCSIDVPAVSKRCEGLQMCELNTQGLAPQDPCVGTYKYYTTNYICVPAKKGKIQINTANYGRTDKTTCSEGRPSSELQNTNCFSPNALAPLSKSCNGMESCEAFATHTVFTDPCVGTYKYLAISYLCVQSAVRSSLVCEHANNTLACDDGTVIHVVSANYGRTDDSTCSAGRPASQVTKTNCYSSNTNVIATTACEGKKKCSLLASNDVFSDPCPNTFKYLYVLYSCIST
ncbi:L-rhamnose-binding lectin CSL2-like isoform X2 [Puntigrus tetrazona]|uniref:L-rhamnose-binding lectin CSL2-like isoform X2 n=1 Tax=Puntigrus tetrazona TaxID=1606681 RepID=UPI001C8A5EF7|nr:L-rhamnose-binding lectin CSL2-like isoform X2 [Puntigrus tetrazona]